MDDLSHRLVNRVVGNAEGAAGARAAPTPGPTLRFDAADGRRARRRGDARSTVDGVPVAAVDADRRCRPARSSTSAPSTGPGCGPTLAVRGGLDVPRRTSAAASTFTLGGFGGHDGSGAARRRRARHRRRRRRRPGGRSPPGLAPVLGHDVGARRARRAAHRARLPHRRRARRPAARRRGPCTSTRPAPASASSARGRVGPRRRRRGRPAPVEHPRHRLRHRRRRPHRRHADHPRPRRPEPRRVRVPGRRRRRPSAGSSASWRPATASASCRGPPPRPPPPTTGGAGRGWPGRRRRSSRVARPSWNRPLAGRGAPRRRRARPPRPADGTTPASRTAGPATASCSSSTAPMTLDLALRLRVARCSSAGSREHLGRRRRRHRRRPLAARPGRRPAPDASTARQRRSRDAEDELGDVEHAALPVAGRAPPAVVGRPGDPRGHRALHARRARRRAVVPVEHRVHPPHQRARRPSTTCTASCSTPSYLVLGLGDVYLGAPVATPLDPRHRLVTTKYNPARTWTPENAVGIGGAYLCIYGMEGPGGYQFVGRTVQVWNRDRRGPHFDRAVAAAAVRPARGSTRSSADELLELRGGAGRRASWRSASRTTHVPPRRPPRASSPTHADGDRRLPHRASRHAFAAERRGVGGERRVRERRRVTRRVDGRRPQPLDRDRAPTAGTGIWIALVERERALGAAAARRRAPVAAGEHLPLAGTTLAVKDNIDVAGLPTTAGCPAFAYDARRRRAGRRRAASTPGAVVIGKTNLDQFATGLVGTRSPYGICPNAHWPGLDRRRVELGLGRRRRRRAGRRRARHRHRRVGTGAGGVQRHRRRSSRPAAGSAPSGVVPACRSLDCVSVFARSVERGALAAVDLPPATIRRDPWSRRGADGAAARSAAAASASPTRRLTFDGDRDGPAASPPPSTAATRSPSVVDVDLAPFLEAGALLYGGAFVAERYEAVGAFVDAHPDDVDPVVGAIIAAAGRLPAWQVFRDRTELARLAAADRAACGTRVDVLVVPDRAPGADGRRGARRADRRQLDARHVHQLREPARPVRPDVPVGRAPAARPAAELTLIAPAWTDDVLVSLATAARYARQPPKCVISRRPSTAIGSHRNPATSVPSASTTRPMPSGAGMASTNDAERRRRRAPTPRPRPRRRPVRLRRPARGPASAVRSPGRTAGRPARSASSRRGSRRAT